MQSYNMKVTIHLKDGAQWKGDYYVEASRDSESAFNKLTRKIAKELGQAFVKVTLDDYKIVGYY